MFYLVFLESTFPTSVDMFFGGIDSAARNHVRDKCLPGHTLAKALKETFPATINHT